MTISIARLPGGAAGSGITFRRFAGLEDIPGMAAAIQRARTNAGILQAVDLEGMRHRYTHLVNSDPLVDCLVVERDGATVGYGRVEWHDLVDGDRIYDQTTVVQPDAWGLGVADALVDWAEARAFELAAAHPTDRRSWFAAFAYGGDREVEGAVLARGYAAVRWDAEMLRPDLDDIADVPLAAGYELRVPTVEELPAVFAMAVEAFAEHWGQSEAGEQRLDEWVDDPHFRRDLTVVAWLGDEPAAMVANVLEPGVDGRLQGLLNGVCTHPRHRRLGLARSCIAESLRLLRDAGAGSAFLGVDTDNHNRAAALYESCGFHVVSSSASYRKPFPMETT